MSLPWFKVFTAVPDHAKVVALMAELDEPLADAYVLRLWDYAARLSPSGRVGGVRAGFVIERAVRWEGDSGALVAAMVTVGLLDVDGEDLVIHDWAQEQGAHVAKVERDRQKPGGKKPPRKPRANPARDPRDPRANPPGGDKRVESREDLPSVDHSPSPLAGGAGDEDPEVQVVAAFVADLPPTPGTLGVLADAWNEITTAPLPRVVEMPTARRKQAQAALKRRPLAEWRRVFEAVEASSFCRGADGGWRANFDWATRAAGAKPEPSIGLLEGVYARAGPAASRDLRRGAVRAEDMAQAHRELPVGVVEDW